MVEEKVQNKLCFLYDGADSPYVKEAAQIKIIYHPDSKNLEKFIEQYPDKKIYLQLNPEDYSKESLHRLQNLKCFDNWTLQIPISMILDKDNNVDDIYFDAIKDCCNRYMFTDLIGNWEILAFMRTLNPSEIYVTNLLGFCLFDVRRALPDEIGVRVICNRAQSAWEGSSDITKFFIRPDDTDVYEEYVAGFDFVGDSAIQDIMYKVYSRGYWYGNLDEIIIGFNDEVDSRRLPQLFGEYRLKCEKRCVQGASCGLCKRMQYFSELMEKTETIIIPKVKQKEL